MVRLELPLHGVDVVLRGLLDGLLFHSRIFLFLEHFIEQDLVARLDPEAHWCRGWPLVVVKELACLPLLLKLLHPLLPLASCLVVCHFAALVALSKIDKLFEPHELSLRPVRDLCGADDLLKKGGCDVSRLPGALHARLLEIAWEPVMKLRHRDKYFLLAVAHPRVPFQPVLNLRPIVDRIQSPLVGDARVARQCHTLIRVPFAARSAPAEVRLRLFIFPDEFDIIIIDRCLFLFRYRPALGLP